MSFAPKRKPALEEESLDQYMRDIGAYPLISREKEAELAARIRAGDDEALNTLIRANLRFVVSVAKRYQNQGVSLADLINEGNLGLIRAARRFDETKGIKFISYAVWWIRQAIFQALAEQSRIVRVPANRASDIHRIGRRAAALLQELGRAPTNEEIAQELSLSEKDVAKAMAIDYGFLSLDAPSLGETGTEACLLDRLADSQNPLPDAAIFEQAMIETVQQALLALKPREAKILRLYFGLDGGDPMTMEDIGITLGITRERVRQVRDRALLKLRHNSKKRALESFLG